MKSAMTQYVVGLMAIIFILSSCSSEEEQKATPAANQALCEYEVPVPVTPLKMSTYPHQLQIPLDQDVLSSVMLTKQPTCYAAHQSSAVHIYKVSSGAKETLGLFATLPEATSDMMVQWRNQETSLQTSLAGLTHFRFQDTPLETIVEVNIIMKDSAHPWHLWHEVGHYVIGKSRAENPYKSLPVPTEEDVYVAKNDLLHNLSLPENEKNLEVLLSSLNTVFDTYTNYIEKRFLDEIVIEMTLIQLASQIPQQLNFSADDVDESIRLIQFYFKLYEKTHTDFTEQLSDLAAETQKGPSYSAFVKNAFEQAIRQKKELEIMIAETEKVAASLIDFKSKPE